LLALTATCALPGMAQDPVPRQLTGIWGTAESLFVGTTEQAELHLYADGFGLLIGSSAPSTISAGPDKGKPGPRVTMGIPLRARFEGATLTSQFFDPNQLKDIGPPFHCQYREQELHCTAIDGKPMHMKRRSTAPDPEMLRRIDEMRIALRSYTGKSSAPPPTPSTRP